MFDSQAQFQAEVEILDILDEDDLLASVFELDGKRVSHLMIEYCHMRGQALMKSIVNTDIAYSSIIEEILMRLYELDLMLDYVPYKHMVVVKKGIKINYKGKLQEIIKPLQRNTSKEDVILQAYNELTELLCGIMSDPTNYASEIDFIKCSALDVEDDSLESSKNHLKEMLNTDVDLYKIGSDGKISEES